jgi:hypothetical protein
LKLKKRKAVISIAAGNSQKPLIIKAKSLGYYVVAIDIDPKAVGLKFADYHVFASTYEPKEIIKKLKIIIDEFDWVGIINRSAGPPVITTSILSYFLKIPGVPINSAKKIVNKDELRIICKQKNIPIGNFKIFSISDKINWDDFNLPVVIKPALSIVGKKGVTVLKEMNQIENAMNYAKSNTINNKIIIEEYLPGPDLSFISFINNKEIVPVCVLDELNTENHDGTISSRGYKTHLMDSDNKIENQILEISNKIVDVFKISRSPLMTCFRMGSDGNLKLIEIHLDLGGDLLIEEVFPRALSFDYEELAVKMSVGNWNHKINSITKPIAIFYEKGESLLNQRPFKIVEAKSFKELDKKIIEFSL